MTGFPADLLAYVAAVGAWAAWHLTWQAALAAGAYQAWRCAAPNASPSARYRVALIALAALPAAVLVGTLAAHGVLAADARLAAADAAAPSIRQGPAGLVAALGGIAGPVAVAYEAAHDWLTWGARAWMAGAALAWGRIWIEWRRLGALRSTARPASPGVRRRVAVLAKAVGLRRAPPVLVVPGGGSWDVGPLVVGRRGRPALLLPTAMARPPATGGAAGVDEWETVVLHELAHVRRGDYTVHLGVRLVEAACWWHPGVRLLARAAADAREECCDSAAVQAAVGKLGRAPERARLALARALVQIALAERRWARERTAGVAAAGGALTARVRQLTAAAVADAEPAGRAGRSLRLVAGLLAAVGAGAVGAGPAVTALAAARGQGLPLAAARSGTVPVRRVWIDAADPAGRFTVRLLNGRVAGATVNGHTIAPGRIRVRGATLRVLGASGAVLVAAEFDPRGALRWMPRPATVP